MSDLVDRGPPGPLSSVYVHVPFCVDRCTYCAFATVAEDRTLHDEFVRALLAEIARIDDAAPLRTLYFGGGTPGLLEPAHLAALTDAFASRIGFVDDVEITLETNPTQVDERHLDGWVRAGVNRLSVGVQTFRDDVLHRFARRHDAQTATRALDAIANRWPHTWSVDLLVGWASQSVGDLESDLDQVLAFAPPHLSVYGLTVEPDTPLDRERAHGRVVTVSEDTEPELDAAWDRRLTEHGLERYEVSNFARSGHRSRHNAVYWRNHAYRGLGPGAASSVGDRRWVHRRQLSSYLRAARTGAGLVALVEQLDPTQRLTETLAVGLRTAEGVDTRELDHRFSPAWADAISGPLSRLADLGMLVRADDRLRIPSTHLTKADAIAIEVLNSIK